MYVFCLVKITKSHSEEELDREDLLVQPDPKRDWCTLYNICTPRYEFRELWHLYVYRLRSLYQESNDHVSIDHAIEKKDGIRICSFLYLN